MTRRASQTGALAVALLAAACTTVTPSPSPRPSEPPVLYDASMPPPPTSPVLPSSSAIVDVPPPGPILGRWRAEPVQVPPNLAGRADQACREVFGRDVPGGAVLALIDARGEGVLDVYYGGAGGSWASCTHMVVGPLGGVRGERGHIVSFEGTEVPAPLKIAFIDFTWSSQRPITASYLVGWAGAAVSSHMGRLPTDQSYAAPLRCP